MSAESDKRRGLMPFRLPLPNPLAWRPAIPGLGRRRQKGNTNFASTSVATISETVLASASQAANSAQTMAPPPSSKVALKPASDVFAGALARACSQSTIHPLDTLKVRLQTSNRVTKQVVRMPPPAGLSKIGQLVPPPGNGAAILAAAPAPLLAFDGRAALAQLGSLYKGVVGAASGAGIAIGAYFAFYGVACNTLSRHTDMAPTTVAFVAGGIAAVGSSFVKVPLAVCIRSVQAGVYPNFFSAARSILAATGPRGLFTGYAPTVLEDVPDMAIKFAAYESMRQVHRKVYNGRAATPQEDFAMGAAAGALAAASTTPLDVIKTNMMCNAAARPSMASAATLVLQQGGPAAFFRGIGTRALSNGINSAVFFCFFEAIRGAIATHKKSHPVITQVQQQLTLGEDSGEATVLKNS